MLSPRGLTDSVRPRYRLRTQTPRWLSFSVPGTEKLNRPAGSS